MTDLILLFPCLDNTGTEDRHPHHHRETSIIPESHQHSGKVSEAWRDRHYRPTPADTVSWSQTGPCRTGDRSGDGTGLASPRELSQCGGSGRGVKDHHGRVSGLRSHGYLHPVKVWVDGVSAVSTFSPVGSRSSNGLRMRVFVRIHWHYTE